MQVFKAATALALCSAISSSLHAAPIVTLSTLGETSTAVAGASTVDFNNGCGYVSCVGAFQIVLGSVSGRYAQPAGTNTPYLSVPNPVAYGSAMFTLGSIANYFGLYWGSIDSYNSIAFWYGGSVIASYSGTDLVGAFANGNQLNYTSNRFINFDFGAQIFDQVQLISNGYAFESDNHAFAFTGAASETSDVPEPAAQLLLLAGVAGLFGLRKRLQKVSIEA
jgi:hypothetical protein